jgi:hypothetical protein
MLKLRHVTVVCSRQGINQQLLTKLNFATGVTIARFLKFLSVSFTMFADLSSMWVESSYARFSWFIAKTTQQWLSVIWRTSRIGGAIAGIKL